MFQIPLGIEESLKNIFTAVLVGGLRRDNTEAKEKLAIQQVCMSRFLAEFPSNIFQNEYAVFYSIIADLNTKVFSVEQLSEVLDNNRDLILKSPYVDLSQYNMITDGRQTTDDEKVEAFKKNMEDMLVELSNERVTEEMFKSSVRIYIDWFKAQFMRQTANNMAMIMSDTGFEEKKPGAKSRLYKGPAEAESYYNERAKILKELSEESRMRSVVVNESWLENEFTRENIADDKTLFTFGIKEIDDVVGELRRSNMLGILGPPKGGKTRFSNFIVQRALSLGLNVAVWPLEGTSDEWISMQLASYIKRTSGVSMNSKHILQKKYNDDPDNKRKKYVSAAKIALATGNKMGRLSFIEGVAYCEDFIDVLEAHYNNENPFDVIVIDSLVNIMSRKNKPKTERISEGYMMLKNYIANMMKKSALAIVPAQLKQSVVDHVRSNPEETLDVTAGGESSETIRSPDEVVGLFSSKEERAANIMRIYSVASRHSGNFDDFRVRCDLQCCHFYSDPSLNNG